MNCCVIEDSGWPACALIAQWWAWSVAVGGPPGPGSDPLCGSAEWRHTCLEVSGEAELEEAPKILRTALTMLTWLSTQAAGGWSCQHKYSKEPIIRGNKADWKIEFQCDYPNCFISGRQTHMITRCCSSFKLNKLFENCKGWMEATFWAIKQ